MLNGRIEGEKTGEMSMPSRISARQAGCRHRCTLAGQVTVPLSDRRCKRLTMIGTAELHRWYRKGTQRLPFSLLPVYPQPFVQNGLFFSSLQILQTEDGIHASWPSCFCRGAKSLAAPIEAEDDDENLFAVARRNPMPGDSTLTPLTNCL